MSSSSSYFTSNSFVSNSFNTVPLYQTSSSLSTNLCIIFLPTNRWGFKSISFSLVNRSDSSVALDNSVSFKRLLVSCSIVCCFPFLKRDLSVQGWQRTFCRKFNCVFSAFTFAVFLSILSRLLVTLFALVHSPPNLSISLVSLSFSCCFLHCNLFPAPYGQPSLLVFFQYLSSYL